MQGFLPVDVISHRLAKTFTPDTHQPSRVRERQIAALYTPTGAVLNRCSMAFHAYAPGLAASGELGVLIHEGGNGDQAPQTTMTFSLTHAPEAPEGS